MELPKVIIDPVGLNLNKPTRYDLYVKDVQGAACGYTSSLTEAEAWKDGIERALKAAYKIGYNNGINER
jgi:hypothetical protein